MKKFMMILLVLLVCLVGCKNNKDSNDDSEPTINYTNVGEVNDSIDILYSEIDSLQYGDEDVQNEISRIRSLYDLLTEEEKALITNYDYLLEIEANYEAYLKAEEEKAQEKIKLEKAVEEAAEAALAAVPSKSYGDNIELPFSYVSEEGINVYIGWTTSSPSTITTTGLVTQPRNTFTRVTLTALCRAGEVQKSVKKVVTINPLAYEELPEKPVFAYYYGSSQSKLTEVERKTIDVINLSFGEIDDKGNVYVTPMNYQTVLQERKYGIRVCFSVQDKEGFKTWTSTAAGREKLAQSFLDVCETYHFDGVDIDWEYPTEKEVSNYVEFMKLLYNKLKNKSQNYLVTSAMYGGNNSSKYNAGVSCQYMDYVHLMTYDFNDPNLTSYLTALKTRNGATEYPHYKNISADSTVKHYISAGVPKEKLVIGAAFYGKQYDLSASGDSFLYQRPTRDPFTISYRNIKSQFLSKIDGNDPLVKVTRVWDEYALAPYLCVYYYNTDGSVRQRAFITYDDAESVKLKTQYVIDEGLGGLMFWQLSEEDRTSNDLVGSIFEVMNK